MNFHGVSIKIFCTCRFHSKPEFLSVLLVKRALTNPADKLAKNLTGRLPSTVNAELNFDLSILRRGWEDVSLSSRDPSGLN